MKWIDKFTATGLQAVLIDDKGRERARVGALPIAIGRKNRTLEYPFMIGRDKAGSHSQFIVAKCIAQEIVSRGRT